MKKINFINEKIFLPPTLIFIQFGPFKKLSLRNLMEISHSRKQKLEEKNFKLK